MFHYASDQKKAAGRALGTLVEIITYCTLRSWGFSDDIVIERKVPEFANPEILHNVEFSFHPVLDRDQVELKPLSLPLTSAKIKREWNGIARHDMKRSTILTAERKKKNAAVLAETDSSLIVANVNSLDNLQCTLNVCTLSRAPYALVECKRVGVEEGVGKGPQTIEKAKQGSYVARTVSSLQKLRRRDGTICGVIEQLDGEFCFGSYQDMQHDIIHNQFLFMVSDFVLSIGVVSNHGNWFTSDNQNKELRVLAESYDWLLFLTDDGLIKFINCFLLEPSDELRCVRDAFLSSYSAEKRQNAFTKTYMNAEADFALQGYFDSHQSEIENWFNVISPKSGTLKDLTDSLKALGRNRQSYGRDAR